MVEALLRFLIRLLIRWQSRESVRALGVARSSKWGKVRDEYIRTHPRCAVTGDTKDCEAHHCVPFHERPDLELDPSNLITLRRDMHFLFGHFLNWTSFNKDVREDAKIWREKIQKRP